MTDRIRHVWPWPVWNKLARFCVQGSRKPIEIFAQGGLGTPNPLFLCFVAAPHDVDRFPSAERGHALRGAARVSMSGEEDAFATAREEDAFATARPDDQAESDPFWAELEDLMARRGKGKGKNKCKHKDYNDVGVQTDLGANQIFCDRAPLLLHRYCYTDPISTLQPLAARAGVSAREALCQQRCCDCLPVAFRVWQQPCSGEEPKA